MIGLFGVFIIQVIGILLWSLLLNAPILQWRSQKHKNWNIGYKDAFFVSIKAGVVALIVIDISILAGALSGRPAIITLVMLLGFLLGLVSWWLTHSNALLKLASSSGMLSIKDARSISMQVFVYILAVAIALALTTELVKKFVS